MSANDESVSEATKLFIFQLRTRPEQVTANCNALLEGSGFRLELKVLTPAQASLFDHLEPDEGGPAIFPIRCGEKGCIIL